MKTFALLIALLGLIHPSSADSIKIEELWSHLFTNGPVLWQAPTNNLPKTLWLYKKVPRIFSATTISNGLALVAFQHKGLPQPSTNPIVIWADHSEGEMQPPCFSVLPVEGQMSFMLRGRTPQTPDEMSKDAAVRRAWDCLAQLGIDQTQFVKTNVADSSAYGVFLPRQIDGFTVFDSEEGFEIQFGKDGKVLQFGLLFPKLERDRQCHIVGPQEIVHCIRAHKAFVLPEPDEEDYFGRLKQLARATKLTIIKITPRYSEGSFGEMPTNESPKIVVPIAELDAIANFGTNNATLRLVAPIISSDVDRLLKTR